MQSDVVSPALLSFSFRKHLTEVQKKNLQRLGTELVEKDKRLTTFLAEKEKTEVASDAWQSKTRRYARDEFRFKLILLLLRTTLR